MAKALASQGDMAEKTISFSEIGRDIWAFTAEGDPNSNSNPRAAEVVQGEVVDEDVVPPASKGIGEETTRVTRVGRRRYTKLRFKGLKGGARPKREDDG